MGLSFRASPVGALATACTVTPRSCALFSSTGRAAADAGTQMVPAPMGSFFQPVDIGVGLEQAVDHHERIVDAVADQVAGRVRRARDTRNGRSREQTVDLGEGAVEGLHHAIELHAHLHGERPAGDVVGALGRAAGIGEIVGVILRLEHVQHVRAEGLVAFHHEAARGIILAGDGEGRCGLVNGDAVLQQRVDEFGGGGEIGLIGGDDVAARIAQFGIVQNLL